MSLVMSKVLNQSFGNRFMQLARHTHRQGVDENMHRHALFYPPSLSLTHTHTRLITVTMQFHLLQTGHRVPLSFRHHFLLCVRTQFFSIIGLLHGHDFTTK